MQVSLRVPLEELEKRERQETNARLAKRIRIIILAIRGYTAPAVAMSLGLSRRVVQRWVRRYNDEGISGLETKGDKSNIHTIALFSPPTSTGK